MARNEFLLNLRQVSFNNVQVSSTDPAGNHPEQDVAGCELWAGNFFDLQERSGRPAERRENGGFHASQFRSTSF
jgi:hypothetical protein